MMKSWKRMFLQESDSSPREETARMLHVKYTTLWRWNKKGYLRCKKVGGRHVLYKYSDVMALLNG